MKTINIYEAKTHLSRLLEQVEAGEEVVLGRAGRPVARLVPYHPVRQPRRLGGWEGKVRIAADFDQTPEDVVALFEGRKR